MSKIITKKQLDLVMESTIKEADYMMEAKDELKLTKNHMDELHKEGHCMCDDKCLVYIEDVAGDVKKMTELMKKMQDEDKDCVYISKEQMDMLHKDGKCDCDDNVTLSYEDEMKEGDYMDDMNDDTTKESACNECGGTMVEGVCEGCSGMSEAGVDEGNEFTKELSDARKEGKPTFTIDGKTYKVEPADKVEESVNKLTKALSKNIDKKVIKEEMDFFNKIIKY